MSGLSGLSGLKYVAVTPGEPAGIGPDLLITFAQGARSAPLVAFTDPAHLLRRASQLRVTINLEEYNPQQSPSCRAGHLTVHPIPLGCEVAPGQPKVEAAAGVLKSIETASQAALRGEMGALLTGPVQKSVISDSGQPFRGHTEMLAELAGVRDVVMLLVSGTLRVALATRHIPLAEVARSLTSSSLETTTRILHQGLRAQFGMNEPRILVAGLNPHAGEDGYLGREEIEIITPTLDKLRAEGMLIEGPLPADTLFADRTRARADAILAMYHDQGLAPFKAVAFGEAVNVTLGLPFVRTSVDHGTALELAGTGQIDLGSFKAALDLASTLKSNGEA